MTEGLLKRIEEEVRTLSVASKHNEVIELCLKYLEQYGKTDPKVRYNLLRSIGNSYFYLSEYNSAEEWYIKLLNELIMVDNKFQLGRTYMGIGGCQFHTNRIQEAEKSFLIAKSHLEPIGDKASLAFLYNWLGVVYHEQKKVFQSLDMNFLALDIAKELNLTWLLESTQNSLGLLFFHEQDFDRALYYYHESLKQNDITKNMIAKADLMNNLGMVYSNTNQLEKAIEYYMNGLHIRLEHFAHDYFRLGHTYTNLGAAEMKFGDLENAEIHLIDAFENYSKIPNNKYFHKRIYIHLANLNLIKKDLVKVEEYINKFESIGETENVVNDRIMNELYLQVKSEYLFELGNYKDSLEYFKRLSTSLITNAENKVDKLSEKYEMKIDYEKKKTEAEILKIKNNELAKTNATKDKLLSLIAHDMRAPLANIIEVLKILATDKSSIPADELDIILNELLDDTSAVYELLQTLLSWVRTQTETFTVNKAEVRIRQLVESACQHMHFLITKKSQKCKIDIPDNQTIYIDQNMLFFIIRNLISNAVKFTPENGIIEIYTNIVKDRLHLSVKDTGVGITEEKLNSIFEFSLDKSTRGTDNEKGSGLGLLLCRDFAKLNDVEIVIESKVDSGSIFSLSIPITQR